MGEVCVFSVFEFFTGFFSPKMVEFQDGCAFVSNICGIWSIETFSGCKKANEKRGKMIICYDFVFFLFYRIF